MAKTGIHIRRCNVGSVEAHNKRTKGYIEGLKKAGVNIYFFQELSRNNRSWVNPRYKDRSCEQIFKDMIEEYKLHHKKHQAPALKDVTRINKKTGKEYTVAGWSPIREGVVPIKEDTKLEDFKPIEEWAQEKGLDVIRIDLHHDEGYKNEETNNIKYNRHAHIVFDWLDHTTGKTRKLNENDMRELQDVVANALGMERGESKAKTGAEHRDVEQQRIYADQQRIKAAEQKMLDIKKDLADANNLICPKSYNWEDDQEEFELKEMVEYFQEDIEEAKNEALDAQKQLSERQIELENTNLSLSKAQKELLAINSTLEEQKRLISQKNAEIEELKALAEKSNEYKELLQNITESLCRGQLLREIIDGREKGIRCIIDLYKDPHARYFSEEQKQEIAEVIGEDKDLVRSYRAKELIIAASRFIISHGLEEDNHDKNIKGQIEAIVQGKEYREQKRGLKI